MSNKRLSKKSKFNIIIDGQFGSTGKGLLSGYLSLTEDFDIFASNLSPNAGHTFVDCYDKKIVTKQLPIGGILNKRSTIYLTSGSIINPDILLDEVKKFNVDMDRIFIHPRAAIVEKDNINWEKNLNSSVSKIASTQSGTGNALSEKILRRSKLVKGCDKLRYFIKEIDLMEMMDFGCTVLMETSQGFDLGINNGLSYPHCTSRDITTTSVLNDAQVHFDYIGSVILCLRTYPIRVGNIYENDKMIGYSGPFYDDQEEISWDDIDENPERTTVTNRIRRVAVFSEKQYKKVLNIIRPNYVFLNVVNYLKDEQYNKKLKNIFNNTKIPDLIGVGRRIDQVKKVNRKKFNYLIDTVTEENKRNKFNLLKRY